MTGTWFKKLLFSYLPIFLMLTFCLSLIFFFLVYNLSRDQAMRSNEIIVEKVLGQLDRTLNLIDKQIIKETTTNDGLKDYFYSSRQDQYRSLVIPAEKLRDISNALPLIDSIYLFRSEDRIVLGKNAIMELDHFGDRDFILKIEQEGSSLGWFPVREYKEFNDQKTVQVVSLVRNIPLLSGEKGFVVINVGVSAINQFVEEMGFSKFSYIQLVDQQGTSLLGIDSPDSGSEMSSTVSPYTGWTMNSGLRDGGLFNVFSQIHWLWLGCILLLLFSGLGWLVAVTRKNYKPIELIVEHIRKYALQRSQVLSASGGNDEFRFIESALNRLIDQSNKYQQQYEEDLLYRRQYFFHEMVIGSRAVTPQEWNSNLNGLGPLAEDSRLLAVVVEIDKYLDFANTYHTRDQSLLKFVLKSVVAEIAEKHCIPTWSEWVTNERLGILYASGMYEETFQHVVKSIIQEMSEWVATHLQFNVTAGIGSSVDEVSEIPLSYEESINALKYKSVLGGGGVISYLEVNSKATGNIYRHLDEIRKLASQFKQGNEEWGAIFKRLFLSLKAEISSKEELVIAVNYLIYHLNQANKETAPEYRSNWETESYPKLLATVAQFEILDEIQHRMHVLLQQAFDHIQELREKRSGHALVQQFKQYLDEQYANENLSLNLISEHFQLNSKYVSQLFKDELGEKFVDYLAHLRIRHAQRLLLKTNESVQNIALQVGYTHSLSFIRMFKKVMDVTPGDYRKLKGKVQEEN